MNKCKLTQKAGDFVKSHLLPKALTNLHKSNKPRVQVDYLGKINRVHDSWYDYNLCTKEGEKILENLDTLGIEELREHNLIWDSWGPHNNLRETTTKDLYLDNCEEGVRIIKFNNLLIMQLFFLSLLWRTAASERNEMKDISISKKEIEMIRSIIADNKHELIEKFPIVLVQLSTKGPIHNRTPYITEFEIEGFPSKIRQARIYIDGLIIRIGINIEYKALSFFNSDNENGLVICKNFHNSLQNEELLELFEAHTNASYLFKKKSIFNAIDACLITYQKK